MSSHAASAAPVADPLGRRVPPAWLFGVLAIPFGVSAAFSATTVGRIFALHHLPADLIAGAVALSILPSALQFLWAPIVDVGIRRRAWLVVMAVISAALLLAATFVPLPEHKGWFITLVVAAQLASGLTGSCNGGLMATLLPPADRARASGWYNAGNVGAGPIGAGVTLWMLGRGVSPRLIGAAVAVMIILPALAAFFVDEPEHAGHRSALETFQDMIGTTWRTLRARAGWTGVLICLSPVGTAAAINLFSSVPDAYRAPTWMVTNVTGFGGGLITAVGSLIGGYACTRMKPRIAYVMSGALTVFCAIAMGLAPFAPSTYAWGALTYYFLAGLCYGTFTAMVLEVVGAADAGASTRYTLFTAAANVAIAYVTWFDGKGSVWFEQRHGAGLGPRGLLYTDAALNLIGIFVLLSLLRLLRPARAVIAAAPAETK